MEQQVTKTRRMEEEKADMMASMYKKLDEAEKEKAQEIERLRDIQRYRIKLA